MREIKFRVWDRLLKKMTSFELKDYLAIQSMIAYTGDFYSKLQMMQFTGLRDKNGKEIYEGDVIHFLNRVTDEMLRRVIKWDVNSYGFAELANVMRYDTDMKKPGDISIEVIGNIHENPELLK